MAVKMIITESFWVFGEGFVAKQTLINARRPGVMGCALYLGVAINVVHILLSNNFFSYCRTRVLMQQMTELCSVAAFYDKSLC